MYCCVVVVVLNGMFTLVFLSKLVIVFFLGFDRVKVVQILLPFL
jgi:hypothetical protein